MVGRTPKPPPLPEPYSVPHVFGTRFLGSFSLIRDKRKQTELNEKAKRQWLQRGGWGGSA